MDAECSTPSTHEADGAGNNNAPEPSEHSAPNVEAAPEQQTTWNNCKASKSSQEGAPDTSPMEEVSETKATRKRRKITKNTSQAEATADKAAEQKTTQRSRKKPYKLPGLPGMPLDVLFEIFKHLMPYDLLKLARITKDFRSLLLNKSSISVWRAALHNVPGLPECPPGMSEPAWANLVFFPHCYYCQTHSPNVEWRFGVRICLKCSKEHLGDLRQQIRQKFFHEEFEKNAFIRIGSEAIQSVIPTRLAKRGVKLHLLSDYDAVEKEYNSLDEESRQAYICERKRVVQDIIKHANLCEAWEKSQTQNRDTELSQLREERRRGIIQKLEELGWASEIQSIRLPDSFAQHKLVNRPQRLTDRIWANIKDEILEYMQQMRDKRLERDYKISENQLMPEPPDFCMFDRVQEILNKPANVEVNVSTFDSVVPLLPELIATWRQGIHEKMALVVKQGVVVQGQQPVYQDEYDYDSDGIFYAKYHPPAPVVRLSDEESAQKLKLASTAFKCKFCISANDYDSDYYDYWDDPYASDCYTPLPSRPLFYPQVLGHLPCLVRTSSSDFLDLFYNPQRDASTFLGYGLHERKTWNCNMMSYDVAGSTAAETIVKMAGLDPVVATSEDMERLNLRFICRKCSEKKPAVGQTDREKGKDDKDDQSDSEAPIKVALYDWRAMVRHSMDQHGIDNISVTRVKAEELGDDILTAEDNLRIKTTPEWACVHCLDMPAEKEPRKLAEVKAHLLERHQIASPVINEDYFQHFAASNIRAYQRPLWVNLENGHLSLIQPQTTAQSSQRDDDEAPERDYDKYDGENPITKNLDSYDGK
ncbi:hypothetical protein BDZ97DRAFT_1818344 [Flammula alnicola]|nr:hypothetical protein BDZ97DRAFT_1818344 [Flammula alnicola]